MKRGLITKNIRKNLKKRDLLKVIIELAADLEFQLHAKLFFEKKIPWQKMDRWTLGTFIKNSRKLKLIDSDSLRLLKVFVELRNKAIHNRFVMLNAQKDSKKAEQIKKLILSICDFLDSNPAECELNLELEKEYSIFSDEVSKKIEGLFKEKLK